MGMRDELIARYAEDLAVKCGVTPDFGLLTKVTLGCGPAIYDPEASVVSGADQGELAAIRNNFLVRKLGLREGPELMAAIREAIDIYGRSEPVKYRAVLYYLLVKYFGKEGYYGLDA